MAANRLTLASRPIPNISKDRFQLTSISLNFKSNKKPSAESTDSSHGIF